jgi:hypothetical protein
MPMGPYLDRMLGQTLRAMMRPGQPINLIDGPFPPPPQENP